MATSNQEHLVSQIPSVDSLKSKIKGYREQEKILDKWLEERAAHQAPLSLGFSRQEHWSGLPFPSPHI